MSETVEEISKVSSALPLLASLSLRSGASFASASSERPESVRRVLRSPPISEIPAKTDFENGV